jgi:hypothetical protein
MGAIFLYLTLYQQFLVTPLILTILCLYSHLNCSLPLLSSYLLYYAHAMIKWPQHFSRRDRQHHYGRRCVRPCSSPPGPVSIVEKEDIRGRAHTSHTPSRGQCAKAGPPSLGNTHHYKREIAAGNCWLVHHPILTI